jgi:hypothetical protein
MKSAIFVVYMRHRGLSQNLEPLMGIIVLIICKKKNDWFATMAIDWNRPDGIY